MLDGRPANSVERPGQSKLSIVINNFNYGHFIAVSIQSALDIEWADKEIIVIDDGSTDDSWKVIQSFGDRITSRHIPNGGQNACINLALSIITGHILIVLDSDDLLSPNVAKEIFSVWNERVVKVQWALRRANADLTRFGLPWPDFSKGLSPEDVRRSLRTSGTYPFSLTSGNAWSVPFLRKLAPLPTRADELPSGFDQFAGRLAPWFGDVITIPRALGTYRIHDQNLSSPDQSDLSKVPGALHRERTYQPLLDRALAKHGLGPSPQLRSEEFCMNELLDRRFLASVEPRMSLPAAVWRYGVAVARSPLSPSAKCFRIGWAIVIGFAPKPIALRVMRLRRRSSRQLAAVE